MISTDLANWLTLPEVSADEAKAIDTLTVRFRGEPGFENTIEASNLLEFILFRRR